MLSPDHRNIMFNMEYRYKCKESNMKEMLLILAKDLKYI